ncbi:MAG: hypothetical protein ABI605_00160 [Rhizobacter sp.]
MIGIDSIKPFCEGDKWKVSLMKGAIAPFKTQMQQEKQKYRKEANKVGACPVLRKLLKPDTGDPQGDGVLLRAHAFALQKGKRKPCQLSVQSPQIEDKYRRPRSDLGRFYQMCPMTWPAICAKSAHPALRVCGWVARMPPL